MASKSLRDFDAAQIHYDSRLKVNVFLNHLLACVTMMWSSWLGRLLNMHGIVGSIPAGSLFGSFVQYSLTTTASGTAVLTVLQY